MRAIKGFGWLVLNGVQLNIVVFGSMFGIFVALLVRLLTGSARLPLRMAAWVWSPMLIRGALARLEVQGGEGVDFDRPCVFVANHQSMIDVCALFMALPVPIRFLLRSELGRVPFLGWYTRATGMVLLKRGSNKEARQVVERTVVLLKAGHSVCAFPEGTRSRDGRVGKFRGGAFSAAMAAGAQVVPIAIEGSGAVMPTGSFRIRPGIIRVSIGQPIQTVGLASSQRQLLAEQARNSIMAMLDGSDCPVDCALDRPTNRQSEPQLDRC